MSPSSSDTTHAKPTRSGFHSRSHSTASFSMWMALGKGLFIIYFIVVQALGMQESFRSTKGNLAHGRFPGPTPAAYDFLSRGNKSVIRWHLHSLFLPVLLFYKYSPHFQGIWRRWPWLTIWGRPSRFQTGCCHLSLLLGQVWGVADTCCWFYRSWTCRAQCFTGPGQGLWGQAKRHVKVISMRTCYLVFYPFLLYSSHRVMPDASERSSLSCWPFTAIQSAVPKTF